MAQYFQEFSGIDPLTMDQTIMVEHFFPARENSEYLAVSPEISEPSVLYQAKKGYYGTNVGADVLIFQPRYLHSGHRPRFYTLGKKRKAVEIKNESPVQASWAVAVYSGEEGNQIPADVLNLDKYAQLYLFPGSYTIRYYNQQAELLATKDIKVQ